MTRRERRQARNRIHLALRETPVTRAMVSERPLGELRPYKMQKPWGGAHHENKNGSRPWSNRNGKLYSTGESAA